ncbi:hypothetical protein [Methanolobus sp. WCC1]
MTLLVYVVHIISSRRKLVRQYSRMEK